MSIKKTVDGQGRTRYGVYIYDSSRKKNTYVATFDRLKDAEEAQYEAKRRMKLGEPIKLKPPREEVTFDLLANRWHFGLVSVRPSTKKDYDKAIRRIKPFIGSRLVSEITRRDVDMIIFELSDKYAPSTVRKTVVVMKMILRSGVEHDHLDKMPTDGSRLALPKMRKRVFQPLSSEQVKALIMCTPEYHRPFVQLLLTTGLRRSEAWGLRVQDVDLERGLLHVRGQLVKRQIVELKTDSSYRTVPLPKQTISSLREHLATLPESELGLLFPTPDGKPIQPSNFYARVDSRP